MAPSVPGHTHVCCEEVKDMTDSMTWEEPPEPRRPSYDWDSIRKRLRRNPGRWLKVFDEDRTTLAVAIRNGGIKALKPSEGIELRTSNNKRGKPRTCTLYLRYNPERDQNRMVKK